MNFLVAALLYHGEEYVAFWNFVSLYETLQLRDIFLESIILNNIKIYLVYLNIFR